MLTFIGGNKETHTHKFIARWYHWFHSNVDNVKSLYKLVARHHDACGLNIFFIDIQTSKTLIQMDINKMMRMEFIQ